MSVSWLAFDANQNLLQGTPDPSAQSILNSYTLRLYYGDINMAIASYQYVDLVLQQHNYLPKLL